MKLKKLDGVGHILILIRKIKFMIFLQITTLRYLNNTKVLQEDSNRLCRHQFWCSPLASFYVLL
jgi:hypothetical protein